MEDAIAAMFGIALAVAVAAALGVTIVAWAFWIGLRRWGPPRMRGPIGGGPAIALAILPAALSLLFLPFICDWASKPVPQPPSLRLVRAVEVPLRSPTDRADLISLFRRTAAQEGMIFFDTSESWRNAPPESRKTLYLALDRPVATHRESEGYEIEARDDGAGTDPWVIFFRGLDPVRATATRGRLVASLQTRFPDTREVPVMPTGALPFRRDLMLEGNIYRVRPDRAADYEVPPGNPARAPGPISPP
jgi:hypothetical protein